MKTKIKSALAFLRRINAAVFSAAAAVAVAGMLVLLALPGNPAGRSVDAGAGTTAAAQTPSAANTTLMPPISPTPALSPSASPLPAPTPSRAGPTPSPAPTAPAPQASPGKAVKPDKAVVIFTFDDGSLSDYLLAYPILKKYGVKGTSYIITKFTDEKLAGKMTWEQIKEMNEYGWVFGCHTCDHRRLSSMTDAEIKRSMESVNRSFLRQGLPAPQIMAYPYGSYNKRVIGLIQKYRKQARLYTQAKFVDLKHPRPYEVPCVKANMRTKGQLNDLERLVDKACKEKAVVVFCIHTLYKKTPYDTVKANHKILSGSAPQTDSRLLEGLVGYCAKKGCAFMDMRQLMDLYP